MLTLLLQTVVSLPSHTTCSLPPMSVKTMDVMNGALSTSHTSTFVAKPAVGKPTFSHPLASFPGSRGDGRTGALHTTDETRSGAGDDG